jgi:hypothetical protein
MALYKPVSSNSHDATPDHRGHLPSLHSWVALAYVCTAVASVGMLARGNGTSVRTGYTFGTYREDGSFTATLTHSSATVAEALMPVHCTILAIYHLYVSCSGLWLPNLINVLQYNPLRVLPHCLALPFQVLQMAILARIADIEKLCMLFFMCALVGAIDAATEFAYATWRTADDKQLPVLHRLLPWMARGLWSLSLVVRMMMWVVLWTNMGWQMHHNREHLSTGSLAMFIVGCVLLMAGQAHHYLSLMRACSWHSVRFNEMVHILCPLALALVLSYFTLS